MHILASDHELQIEIAGQTWTMPTGAHVRLVFDGPVVELFGKAGVFAARIPIAGGRTISITNSACSIRQV
jgi:hypothetical protein